MSPRKSRLSIPDRRSHHVPSQSISPRNAEPPSSQIAMNRNVFPSFLPDADCTDDHHHHHHHVRLLNGIDDDRRRRVYELCPLSLSLSLYFMWTPLTEKWLELWPKGQVWIFDPEQVRNQCGWMGKEWLWYLKRWDEMGKEEYNECTHRVHGWWDRGDLNYWWLDWEDSGVWWWWRDRVYLGGFRPFLVEK